jgi:hypothetical protein
MNQFYIKKRENQDQYSNNHQAFFQPAAAWILLLGFSFITILLILLGLGKLLNYLFPVGGLVIGILLYFKYPILYNGLLWWAWLISPLVRRFADYKGGGFTDPSPILLTPYLITLISIITLYKKLPKVHRIGGLPFIFVFMSLFYSFLVGLLNRSPVQVCIALLDWLAPVLLGFHLFVNWKYYPSYRQNTQRVFTWGLLLLGIYGIIQYLLLPEWDRFWMINAEISSIGTPAPMAFRIWSTLNSGEPFAAWMAAALLLIFNSTHILQFPAIIIGFLSFLLAMVRSAWLGWITGLFVLWQSLKSTFQIRLIIILCLMVVMIIPLATLDQFSAGISERLSTFSSLENDNSAKAREETYKEYLNTALSSYLGEGLGGPKYDSTVLAMLLNLGLLGTLFYLTGLFLFLFSLFHKSESQFDPFIATSRAIVVSVLIRIPLNTALSGVSGLVLWGFIGLSLGAQKYHHTYSKKSIDYHQKIPMKI